MMSPRETVLNGVQAGRKFDEIAVNFPFAFARTRSVAHREVFDFAEELYNPSCGVQLYCLNDGGLRTADRRKAPYSAVCRPPSRQKSTVGRNLSYIIHNDRTRPLTISRRYTMEKWTTRKQKRSQKNLNHSSRHESCAVSKTAGEPLFYDAETSFESVSP